MKEKINKQNQKATKARQESPFNKGAVSEAVLKGSLTSKIQPLNSNAAGITLIALIITVIVMLILVAVTIDIAVDGKLFDKAEEAVSSTNNKTAQLQNRVDELMGVLDEIELEQNCTHTYGDWVVTIEATCTKIGTKTRTCTKCGNIENTSIAVKSHEYTNGTCTNCGSECSHTYGNWTTTKEASCTEAGERTRTCTICGYTQTEEITVEHTFSEGTCTECGTTCASHTYGEWEVITQASCTATGTQKRICTVCGQGETQEIGAIGHSYGEWVTITAATCTTAGTESKTCSRCNDVQTQAIEALGHNYVNGTCSRCGDEDLVTFTISSVTYTTVNGWTWEEWVNSDFNTGGYVIVDGEVRPNATYSTNVVESQASGTDEFYQTSTMVIKAGCHYATF